MTVSSAFRQENLALRRALVVALNAASWLLLGLAMASLLGAGGWSWPQAALLLLFLLGLPWTLLGFWNAVIGFCILKLAPDPAFYVTPCARSGDAERPLTLRTAICIAVRHEDVARLFARIAAMVEELVALDLAPHVAVHVLSDSSRPEIAAAEAQAFARLAAQHSAPGLLHYRRRSENSGYKAGNLREFAERTAGQYDLMLVLDADSLMSGAAMRRLLRIMQAHPEIGILQTLVVGRPADSAFARIFQFGMRHGMRPHTVGIAWWQGPDGPYWGHNAVLRLAPFLSHCALPAVPGRPPLGGVLLSHDQVEAVLMRTAGYEVRVIAEETESWEENPPSLPDFITRDLRWCQGNLQYLTLLGRPGLRPLGRFQLLNAIMMYVGAPAWVLMLGAGLAAALTGGSFAASSFPAELAFALYAGMMAIGFAPRLLGLLEVATDAAQRRRYGGLGRLLLGGAVDALFSLAAGPLVMVAQARFVFGLLLGKHMGWEAQARDRHGVPLGEALRGMAPQMLFGLAFAAALWAIVPAALPWASPTLVACALAVPVTCLTAAPRLGALLRRWRLCAVPDELAPAPILRRLGTKAPVDAPAAVAADAVEQAG